MDLSKIPAPETLKEIHIESGFTFWAGLGESRTYAQAADHLKRPAKAVMQHAIKFKWVDKLKRAKELGVEKTIERVGEAFADINEEHADQARRLRRMAFQKLMTGFDLAKPADMIRLFDLATKFERDALGLDTNTGEKQVATLLAEQVLKLQAKQGITVSEAPEGQKAPEVKLEFELDESLLTTTEDLGEEGT